MSICGHSSALGGSLWAAWQVSLGRKSGETEAVRLEGCCCNNPDEGEGAQTRHSWRRWRGEGRLKTIPKFNSMGLTDTFDGRWRRIWGDCQLLGVWGGSINSTFPPAQVLNQLGNKARGKQYRNENTALITVKAGAGDCSLHVRPECFFTLQLRIRKSSVPCSDCGTLFLEAACFQEEGEKRVWAPLAPCSSGVEWVMGGEHREIALQGFLLVVANNSSGKSLGFQFVSFI